jgi:hypothetical protein
VELHPTVNLWMVDLREISIVLLIAFENIVVIYC